MAITTEIYQGAGGARRKTVVCTVPPLLDHISDKSKSSSEEKDSSDSNDPFDESSLLKPKSKRSVP